MKSYSQNRHPRSTRNIQIGWKHKSKKGFVLVSEGKGGGKYHVDIEKSINLERLETIIRDKYFPEGRNSISNLSLQDLKYFIATFTGKPLPSTLTNGDAFTLGGFLGENPSSPIRLYLHTQLQSDEAPVPCAASPALAASDSDEYEKTDTPTISFRRRRLSLRRNIQTPRDTGGPSSQEPSQTGGPSSQEPSQTGGPSSQEPSQTGGPSSQEPSQTGGPSSQEPSQTGGPSSQEPSQTGGPSSQEPSQTGGLSSQEPSQTGGPSSQEPSQTGGPSSQEPSQTGGLSSQEPSQTGGPSSQEPSQTGGPSSQEPSQTGGPSSQEPSQTGGLSSQEPSQTGGPSSQEPSQGTSSGHRYMLTCQDAANLIEISDSDSQDEEMEMAIAASLLDNRNECRQQTDENLPQLLEDFFQKNIEPTEGKYTILVYSRRVLESGFRALSRPTFNPKAKLNIKFCEGEMAQDYGGPKREFLRLALDELAQSNMFTGLNDDKLLQHSVENLEKGSYKLAGMIVALSYVHDGAGPHFLNKHLFEMMTELPLNNLSSFNVATLNVEERQLLEKLQTVENHSSREQFLQQYGDWLIDQGFSNPYSFKIEDKDQLFTRIIKQLVLYRQSSEILQFKQGMNEICGFWEFVRQHAYAFMPSFCNPPTKLTKDSFLALCNTKFAEEGSSRRRQEEDTQYAWELFLLDIEENDVDATFPELLAFITGADKVPCRGFPQKISISFYSMEEGEKRFPFASTCSLELFLPRNIQDPELFRELMMTSLRDSYGFGKI